MIKVKPNLNDTKFCLELVYNLFSIAYVAFQSFTLETIITLKNNIVVITV